ncbi:MAG: ATP-dependent DNA helicase PcrA [Candidatus Nomurabacteria bacterium GW2011_GWD2_39_12]|uniref:DNA 3'-5' helicase n=1 Tax=Candidatus Nomurabacteria bacterium GW2011_GWD2_39_12 TaxID=1618759 RepID=A0A837HX82_9BACT|nr:MAG: ATP-dependent DNA helicase PcrA [Candidatus Nomurabacteria bacterium GW2011_GWD2_39_12]
MEDIKAIIHGDATSDQIEAIDHIGSHARLLAGPGTGKTKTLTRRVLSLILQHNADPDSILLLTFTRLAAAQLKDEIKKVLEPLGKTIPQVSTLHSFALRQILYNSSRIDTLPRPIRIADDWEERYIIQEDLKKVLKLKEIGDVQKLINQLSTDWETLRIDEIGWEQQFPNPAFLGAWRSHKDQYGETLRAELVYQLKKQLNQSRDFQLDKEYKHILIDEYQDLNACDLAIVNELAKRGAELFVAGDDDQSIYGFRFATPAGIRNFEQIYQNSKKLALEICFRCDKNILHSAEFVASLDPARLPKPTRPKDEAEDGEVLIIGFKDQSHEAEIIAKKIKSLIDADIKPDQITILLRNDRNGLLSKPIIETLKKYSVDVSLTTDSELENNKEYRTVLSIIRLLVDQNDCLAWRTLLQTNKANGLGDECIKSIWNYAQSKGIRFSVALQKIAESPSELQKFGPKIAKFVSEINVAIVELKAIESPIEAINATVDKFMGEGVIKEQVKKYFVGILENQEKPDLENLIKVVSTSSEYIEQETKENAVNILTMHQAKGLSFDVCFIVGAEDEYIPGRNTGDKEGDERRLLYVSMTRARHKLFISYCNKRTGQQRHSGSNSGTEKRTLTRFLRDSKIPIKQVE